MTTDVVEVEWRGLKFGGPASRFWVKRVMGWWQSPQGSYESTRKTDGHGEVPTGIHVGRRIVVAEGHFKGSPETRDTIIRLLGSVLVRNSPDDTATEPLTVTMAGQTGVADAQLLDHFIDDSPKTWASGIIPWSIQWRCPLPYVYGQPLTVWEYLVAASVGIQVPQTVPFSLPAKPIGGAVPIYNEGSVPSDTLIRLTGAQNGVGVLNATTGAQMTYPLNLGLTDVFEIDTERGGAFLNGKYRAPYPGLKALTGDLRAAPGANLYQALGAPAGGSPTISVTVRPRLWW